MGREPLAVYACQVGMYLPDRSKSTKIGTDSILKGQPRVERRLLTVPSVLLIMVTTRAKTDEESEMAVRVRTRAASEHMQC